MVLCKYANILGVPKEGIHSYRIFNIAIFDVILMFVLIIVSFYIGVYFGWIQRSIWTFVFLTMFWFVIGVILHRVFCVNSTINKAIFGEV